VVHSEIEPARRRSLTTAEYARLKDVGPETVRRWVKRGLVQPSARTSGRHMLFEPDAADSTERETES
jgi:DNA-binding transcriptional MerR regulator